MTGVGVADAEHGDGAGGLAVLQAHTADADAM